MLAQLTQQVALAFVTTKTLAFAAIALGTLGSVTFPAISSIKANNVLDSEQVGLWILCVRPVLSNCPMHHGQTAGYSRHSLHDKGVPRA